MLVKVKIILRKYQAQFRKQLRKLKIKQSDVFLIKNERALSEKHLGKEGGPNAIYLANY